ncbi:MAG TPA: hypothetical protein VFO65_04530 [Acidimicrobiales bacterium]|nr:hypothetical protein [Acidimicrobiales bacterium]
MTASARPLRRSPAAWPAVLVASPAALVVVHATGVGPPVGAAVGLWFALSCPGAAVVGLLGIRDRLVALVLVMVVSLSVDTAVATALFYAGAWAPGTATAILVALSLGGALLQSRRRGRP